MSISRRHFLQSTGVAASTLAVTEAAAAAQGPAKPISANDRVQIGCIGFGIMGQGDMKTESSLPGVEIVAVSDVYDGRRTLAQERYGKHVFTTCDYRELLARRDVDAVVIATPRSLARPHCHRCSPRRQRCLLPKAHGPRSTRWSHGH